MNMELNEDITQYGKWRANWNGVRLTNDTRIELATNVNNGERH